MCKKVLIIGILLGINLSANNFNDTKKLCDEGIGDACSDIGTMYFDGSEVQKSYKKSVEYWQKSCNLGSKMGCTNLGVRKMDNDSKDKVLKKESFEYYKMACNNNVLEACVNLGSMYIYGIYTKKDFIKAVKSHKKACDGGNMAGCFNLAVLLENGVGCKKDYSKASILYQRSCDKGYPKACKNLANMYVSNRGVKQDFFKAKSLYKKACAGNLEIACKDYEIMRKTISGKLY